MSLVNSPRLLVIAGPCLAESEQMLDEVAGALNAFLKEQPCDFYFKASFDKANRTSLLSSRGPGLDKALQWFDAIKKKHNLKIMTDIHEPQQAEIAAEVCDGLQIPAFLCRQTDLITAAVKTKRFVNIKKGQFMSPHAAGKMIEKARLTAKDRGIPSQVAVTERGVSFGYGDLVVDPRGFYIMAKQNIPVIFDVTHSTQAPPATESQGTTGASRQLAPLLARSAAVSGYLSGVFLEVHPEPEKALSDSLAQLSITQSIALLKQILPIWQESLEWVKLDKQF